MEEENSFERLREVASRTDTFERLGGDRERELRATVLRQVEAVLEHLPESQRQAGIGHNNPPTEFTLDSEQLSDVRTILVNINVQMQSDTPNVKSIVEDATKLQGFIGWIAEKCDMTVSAFCKSFGGTIGKGAGLALPAALADLPYWEALVWLLNFLNEWMVYILMLLQ